MSSPRARMAVAAGGSFAVAVIVCAIAPLVGVDTSDGGRRLELLDVAAIRDPASVEHQIFFLARLPRVLAGAVVGAGLAAAGVAFQALLRNPLAEPFTLGVSSGASFAAVLAIRLGFDDSYLGSSAIGIAALLGSGVTAYLVWRLARVGRDLPAASLLLAGVTVAVICGAATMVVQHTSTFREIYRFIRWTMGGLEATQFAPVVRAAVPTALGVVALVALARDFNAMAAGPDAAASLGVDPRRVTTLGFAASSVVVGAGISVAGPVGFVGLLVPHALRGIVGPDHRILLPVAVFTGAAFVVVCDTLARTVLAPDQLPVGIVTALIGGPFFLYLLVGEKRRGRLWG